MYTPVIFVRARASCTGPAPYVLFRSMSEAGSSKPARLLRELDNFTLHVLTGYFLQSSYFSRIPSTIKLRSSGMEPCLHGVMNWECRSCYRFAFKLVLHSRLERIGLTAERSFSLSDRYLQTKQILTRSCPCLHDLCLKCCYAA